MELIRAGNLSLSVDEFDARFDRARSLTIEGQTDLVRFGLDL